MDYEEPFDLDDDYFDPPEEEWVPTEEQLEKLDLIWDSL